MVMLRRLWLWVVIVAIGAIAVAAVVAESRTRAPEAPKLPVAVVSATLAPRAPAFGDLVVARVELLVDRERVDLDELELVPRFAPYQQAGEIELSRHDVGRTTRLTETISLNCLTLACVPASVPALEETKSFQFPPAQFVFHVRGQRRVVRAEWPELHDDTQLAASELPDAGDPTGPTLEAIPALDEPSYRLSSGRAQALLLALAALMLLGTAALVRPYLRRAPPPPPLEETEPEYPELSPLERALAGLEWARDHARAQEQRKALELLTEELEIHDELELAEEARALAWSPEPPERAAIELLAARVRNVVEAEAGAVPV